MLGLDFRDRWAVVALVAGCVSIGADSALAGGRHGGRGGHGSHFNDTSRQPAEPSKGQESASGGASSGASAGGSSTSSSSATSSSAGAQGQTSSQGQSLTSNKATDAKAASDTSEPTEKSAAKGKAAKSSDDRPDAKVPDTLAEWFKQLSTPAAVPATPVAPVAKKDPTTTTTPVPTVTPVATAPTATPAAPAAAAAGVKRNSAKILVPTPVLTFERPELLAQQLSEKALARAEAIGFKFNGSVTLPGISQGYTRLLAPDGMTTQQAKEVLRQELPGNAAEPNLTYSLYRAATSDPATSDILSSTPAAMATSCGTDRCFGSDAIRWQPRLQSCARNVAIGIIDTGIDRAHVAFSKRRIELRPELAAAQGLGFAKAPDWHGTGVAAILAGDAQSATPGLVPDARYFVADVFFAGRDGFPVTTTAHLLEALNWLEAKGVNVINMSLAGPKDELLKTAIATLSRKGIIVVAAVGNEGPTAAPTYPSAYEQVIAVTAVNKDLSNYRYANRGNHVDLAAPGVGIWTAMPGGKSGYHTGTSFAAPYVTAMVAAIYNGLPAKTKSEVLARLTYKDLGAAGRDPIYGRGLALAPTSCGPTQSAPETSAFVTTVSIRKP